MDLPKPEIINIIYYLLPGFITAWIFYSLTAYRRLSPFERTVQALIFTGIIQAIVLLIRGFLLLFGKLYFFGEWSENTSFVTAIILSILIGLVFSLFANKDWFHKFLRGEYKWPKWLKCPKSIHKFVNIFGGITSRTSYPHEWFGIFNTDKRYINLYLKNGRRLYGWPFEWPDHPDSGHFVITEPEWVMDNNDRIPLYRVFEMLVPVTDVDIVEFVKWESEIKASPQEIQESDNKLIKLQGDEEKMDDQISQERDGLEKQRKIE